MNYPLSIVDEYLAGDSTVKLSQRYNIHYSSIRNFLIKNGVKLRSNRDNSRRYAVDHGIFSVIDTEEKAYWLGFLYADGYVSSVGGKKVGLSLSTTDMKHLEKFKAFIGAENPICVYHSSGYGNGEYGRIIIASDKMYDDLVGHGVLEHKSNILEFPTWLNDDLKRHFLRGYIDGDGCITKNGNSYAVKICGTHDFHNGVIEYLKEAGVFKYGRTEKRRSNCEVLSLNMFGETAYGVIKLLYTDEHIALDRKYDVATSALSYFSRLYQ